MGFPLRFLRLLPLAAVAAAPVLGSAACNAQLATVLSSDASADSSGGGGGGASCNSDQECNDNPAVSSLHGKCSPHSDESRGVCVCNPGISMTPNGKCGKATGDGGTNPDDCVAKGGVCLGKSTPPPNYRPAGNGEGTCAGDAACWVPEGTSTVPICFTDQQCNGDSSVSSLWGKCFYGVCMCNDGYTVQPSGKCHKPPPPECATQKGTCRQQPAQCLADELASALETEMSCGDFIAATCCNKKAACNGPAREAAGSGYVPVDFTCCSNMAAHAPICVNGWQTCPKGDTPVALPGGCL